MFRVGQKVVCVDDRSRNRGGIGTIKRGVVYTVRWVGVFSNVPCIRVDEIVRPCGDDRKDYDTPYLASRFRPIVEKKTDISFAHEILRKATKKGRVKCTQEMLNAEVARQG